MSNDVKTGEPVMDVNEELEAERRKSAEYYDQLLRLKAEFENFRKRTDREKIDARAWGKQEVLMPLLSFADVFEQAMGHARSASDPKEVITGFDLLQKALGALIKAEGIQPIDILGKPYDPHLAEAVEQTEVEDESLVDMVIGEIQRGYTFQGQVLRPSQVRVGVAKKETKETTNEEGISDVI